MRTRVCVCVNAWIQTTEKIQLKLKPSDRHTQFVEREYIGKACENRKEKSRKAFDWNHNRYDTRYNNKRKV